MAEDTEGGAEMDFMDAMTTEYVQGRTKRTVTAASALNELRLALEAVSSRVSGKKPQDDYEPRTRSRADKDAPEELTADVGDGTRIDAVQLIQELAVILRGIAEAPSAAAAPAGNRKKKTKGGSVADSGSVVPGPIPDGPVTLPTPVMSPAEVGQSRPNPTFGGGPAPVEVVNQASTMNAPNSPPAMIGPDREAFAAATFGGQHYPQHPQQPRHHPQQQPPQQQPQPQQQQQGGQMIEVGAAPVNVAFQGAPRPAGTVAAPAILGQARAPLTSQVRGAQHGGVASVDDTGLQNIDAPDAPVVGDIGPDEGYYRVIQLPEP